MRTKDGYIPYDGGGIAFDFRRMRMKGVHPTWYRRDGYTSEEAMSQLIEDGIFNEDEVLEYQGNQSFSKECEWTGSRGMQFSPADIKYVWIGNRKRTKPFDELRAELQEFMPKLIVKDGPPPSG